MSEVPNTLYQAVFDVLDEGVLVRTRGGRSVAWNRAATDLLGLSDAQLLGQEPIADGWELVGPGGSTFDHRVIDRDVDVMVGVFGVRHADGTERWLRGDTRELHGDHGHGDGGLVVTKMVDVSVHRRATDELHAAAARVSRADERYRTLFDNAPVGMVEIDEVGVVRAANQAFVGITGISARELLGAAAAPLLGFISLGELLATGSEMQSTDGLAAHEIRDETGESRFLMIKSARLDADTENAWLIQVADVTEGARLEQQLRYLADHDPITGLMNRRSFTAALEDFVASRERRDGRAALLLIDLDNFKSINDTLGHAEGDRVIGAVADVILERVRESDQVARLGGDEFAVFARDCDLDGATSLADDLVTAIRDGVSAGAEGGTSRPVTASIGATMWRRSHRNVDAFVADADKALYEAKDAGRDISVVLGKLAPALFRSPLSWIERIEAALSDERFELFAQPIVELEHGTIVCDELLLRMIDEDGNRIPPGAWIVAAERAGIFTRLDHWVIDSAIPLAARHRAPVSINISGRSVQGTALLDRIERTIDRNGIEPSLLTFEVTETSAITNMTEAQRFLRSLRAMGCLAALDDFGRGFGSFQYLKHLPFDVVKVDGEFVRECDTNRTDRAVIRSVVEISRDVGAVVVAEHIETASVLDTVVSLGVQRAQGYLLGIPTVADTAFAGRRRSVVESAPVPSAR